MSSAPAHHGVLVYDSDEAFAAPTAAFLEGGVTSGESVVAVVDPAQRQMLDDALGDATAHVTFLDRDSLYTRPEAALAAYDAMLRRTLIDGAPSVRLYGELAPCTTSCARAGPARSVTASASSPSQRLMMRPPSADARPRAAGGR